MNRWSNTSKRRLEQCDERLQQIAERVLPVHDCSVLTGHRGEAEQTQAFSEGYSSVQWPYSKHNKQPSLAIDLAPFPIDWDDAKRFYYFAGIVMGVAAEMGITLRWGGDWDRDNDLNDSNFLDLVHFELVD